jgi:hypothetical protein
MLASPPDTDRRDSPSSSAALLLAALVGGVLGAAADRLLFAEPTRIAAAQDAGAPPAAAVSPTLQDELKSLSAAITDLKASVDRLAPPAAAPSPAALAPSPDVQELLAQLVAAVSETTQRLRDANTAPLVIPPTDAERSHRLEALTLDSATLDAQHLFWPAQAVLDAYGRPTAVYVNDRGEQWRYELAKPHEITFTFHEGRVIEVWTQ